MKGFYILCLLFAFVLGCLFTYVLIFAERNGVLVITQTEEKDLWSFIVESPTEVFKRKKLVIFSVKHKKEDVAEKS